MRGKGFGRMSSTSQTTLLRVAAFLVDTLSLSVVLVLPASLISYTLALVGGSVKGISIVWAVTIGILIVGILIRDGYRGRSIGKQLLGLRLMTPHGEGCGYARSCVRNFPLIVPVWNVIELGFILAGRPRTGDRIASTTVTEE